MFRVYLKYTTLKSKTVVNAFGANFEKIGLLLIPISAHTDKRMSTRLNVDKYVQIRLPFEHFSRMKCHCVGFTKEGFKHYCSAIMQCYDMQVSTRVRSSSKRSLWLLIRFNRM